ncbi:hypothetical protein O6H91_02G156900 [Diphasiastrum complanatum]|uniref:Uncharacterized protein n=1 Tax=Diphasiastrum complanatum TaxID=34168 RepID=A0ACC2EMI1_DIPCM|nr:hypothetical protein O6H91_02G156900 [Diphasiastrum complanatum]
MTIPILIALATFMIIVVDLPVSTHASSFTVTNQCQEPILMQCHSHDNNLGQHLMQQGAHGYWHYYGNLWTVFTCDFENGGRRLHQEVWTWNLAFRWASNWDIKWELREDGIWMLRDDLHGNDKLFGTWY